jgi:arylsulfatase A-like enzyme
MLRAPDSKKKMLSEHHVVILALAIALAMATVGCGRDSKTDPQSAETTKDPRPNIILLTVDTLRADHLRLYGYARDTMPAIEEFARAAVVFENAVVPRGSTRPSYSSMLTGQYPFRHGVRSNSMVLNKHLRTLPEVLRDTGYHTAGFVSNFVLLGEMSGLQQGFDLYDDNVEEREAVRENFERTAANTRRAILDWLDSNPPEPFFLFINFIDPHGPYTPPERHRLFRSDRERLLKPDKIPEYQKVNGILNYFDYVDRYDAEIRYTDEAIRFLINDLKDKGSWDNSLVVFTADHGESLGEHKILFKHVDHLWEETTRVPLAIRMPRRAAQGDNDHPRRVRTLASPMDIMPTILAYLNIATETKFDGRNLLPVVRGKEDLKRAMLIEYPNLSKAIDPRPDLYAIRTPTHKLIREYRNDTAKLVRQAFFHIEADPLEQQAIPSSNLPPGYHDLAQQLESFVEELRAYEPPFTVAQWVMPLEDRGEFVKLRKGTARESATSTLTQDHIRKLRSLGYVQ